MTNTPATYAQLCLIVVFTAALLLAFAGPARAQINCLPGLPCIYAMAQDNSLTANKSDSAACDANFMNQIYAKAFLEAQQDNMIAETILRKPDSVLQYSCFDKLVKKIADHTPEMFSESKEWSTDEGGSRTKIEIDGEIDNKDVDPVELNVYMAEGRLADDLEFLVLKSLKNYTDNNFPYELGGFPSNITSDINDDMDSVDSTYYCAYMNQVWNLSHCDDYGMTDDTVLSLSNTLDSRVYPAACGNMDDSLKESHLALAANEDYAYVDFDPADFIQKPYLTTDDCSTAAPVPTGVMIQKTGSSMDLGGKINSFFNPPYEEHICPTAGCYYDPDEEQCKP